MWAVGLHHPYHLGDPQRFKVRDKIRSGPHVGPAIGGVPNALERGTKSEVAHMWAD